MLPIELSKQDLESADDEDDEDDDEQYDSFVIIISLFDGFVFRGYLNCYWYY